MRLEQTPKPEHSLRVSAKLITSSTILHLSAEELERAVSQEQVENPVFEATEQQICLFCGTRLYGQGEQICMTCSRLAPSDTTPRTYEQASEPLWIYPQQVYYDVDNSGFAEIDRDEEYDVLAHIPTMETLSETLLRQLEVLVAPEDAPIAEQLVGNLNERGYLEVDVREIAEHLQTPIQRVEYVLKQLQTLEPPGIGARNLRECLLIQLDTLSEQYPPHPLTRILIDQYLDQLGHNQFLEIARQLKASEQDVRQAAHYIRSTLHPFPAHTYRDDGPHSSQSAAYIRPDLLIRKGDAGFEVELIEEKRYRFHIGANYGESGDGPPLPGYKDVQRYMHQYNDRAKFFVECVQRRWRTLRRVAELVVSYQREFLEKGVRYLRPLTRAEVSTRLNLDEGTVSRAIANKYALLPNGRLIPLADFFDSSLGIKDIIRELIQSEDPRHRLSDEELARLLTLQGITMARRTVTKYREEMGIGSSRER
jgi:RNA polymerase sigma-54 factor